MRNRDGLAVELTIETMFGAACRRRRVSLPEEVERDARYLEKLTHGNCVVLLMDHQIGTMPGVQNIRLDHS